MQIIFLTFLFLKYSSASIDKKTLEILDNLKEFEEYQRPPDQKSPDDFSDNERYQRIPRGHLKPIGANMDPMEVEILDHLPDSVTFYEEYVRQSRPVIFRGAAERMETYNDWKSDDLLKKNAGRWKVDYETGKKEDRKGGGHSTSFASFIDNYNHSDTYLVADIVKKNPLAGKVLIPKPLTCEWMSRTIGTTVMWFSSGGTKSVLHNDAFENINCLFDGTKELIMAHKRHVPNVKLKEQGKYSNVDVDSVDMNEFPHFENIPWYRANMNTGDCLFIPLSWVHHVNSSKTRNLAINFWFYRLGGEFPQKEKEKCEQHNPEYMPLNTLRRVPTYETLQIMFFELFDGVSEPIRKDIFFDCVYFAWSEKYENKKPPVTKQYTDQVFESIDSDGDGLLWFRDLYETKPKNFGKLLKLAYDPETPSLEKPYHETQDELKEQRMKEEL